MATKYSVEVKETLSRIVEVEAASKDEAIKIVREQYRNEEIILDSDNFCCCKIQIHE